MNISTGVNELHSLSLKRRPFSLKCDLVGLAFDDAHSLVPAAL